MSTEADKLDDLSRQLAEHDRNEHWHLDKRVPISLIGAIVLQTVAVVALIVQMHSSIDDNERRLDLLEVRAQERAVIIQQNVTAIAVIHENLRNIAQTLERIEDGLVDDRRDRFRDQDEEAAGG